MTGNEAFDITDTAGGKLVGGGVGFATGAVAGDDKTRVDDATGEGDAFVGGLSVDFVGVESEVELTEKMIDDSDVAHDLGFLRHGYDDEEVVDVAAIMFITEVDGDKAVELVEKDIGKELAGEIANNDTVAGAAVKEALVIGEGAPIFA